MWCKFLKIFFSFLALNFSLKAQVSDSELEKSKAINYISLAENTTDLELAKNYYLSCHIIANDIDSDSIIVESGEQLFLSYFKLNVFDSAIFYMKINKRIAQKTHNVDKEISANLRIANSYMFLTKDDSAATYLKYCDELFKKNDSLKLTPNYISYLGNKGQLLKLSGNTGLALKCFLETIKVNKGGSQSFDDQSNMHIAEIHLKTKNYEDALKFYKKCIPGYSKVKNMNLAYLYQDIGVTFTHSNQVDSAFLYFEKSKKILDTINLGVQSYNELYLEIVGLYYNINVNKASFYFSLVDTTSLYGFQYCQYYLHKARLSQGRDRILLGEKAHSCIEKKSGFELKQEIAFFLYQEYKKTKNIEKTLTFLQLRTSLKDKLRLAYNKAEVERIMIEDILGKKKEELKLAEVTNKIKSYWIVLIVLILFLFLVLIYMVFKAKNKTHKQIKKRKEILEKENLEIKDDLTNISLQLSRDRNFLQKTKEELKMFSKENSELRDLYVNTNQFIISENNKNNFEEKIKSIEESFFYELDSKAKFTKTEKKLAALLKLNMTTKEIAPILGVSQKSIEVYRYKLRKKLNLNRSESIHDYLKKV